MVLAEMSLEHLDHCVDMRSNRIDMVPEIVETVAKFGNSRVGVLELLSSQLLFGREMSNNGQQPAPAAAAETAWSAQSPLVTSAGIPLEHPVSARSRHHAIVLSKTIQQTPGRMWSEAEEAGEGRSGGKGWRGRKGERNRMV